MTPVEPPPTRWRLPDPELADADGIAGVGADLEPGTLLAAYRDRAVPDAARPAQHGVVLARPAGDHPPRRAARQPVAAPQHASLHRPPGHPLHRGDGALRRPSPPGGWITPRFVKAYERMHRLGWAHSFECYDEAGELVGGLYGIRIGGFFAGESMFHAATDASKVALVALVDWLRETGASLLDVQWMTPHLRSLGAVELSRSDYLDHLRSAVDSGRPAIRRAH